MLSWPGRSCARSPRIEPYCFHVETASGSGCGLTKSQFRLILSVETGMPVLIDGNNLLFAARDADPERPPSRSTLCLRLGQWARRTGERVVLVFDGPAPAKSLARQISDPDVVVSFSGGGVTADEVLTRAIAAHSAPRRLLVVSSDHEVAGAGRRRRARTARADVFWRQVQRDLTRPPRRNLEAREKQRGLSAEDAQRWLSEFGLDGAQWDDGPADMRT